MRAQRHSSLHRIWDDHASHSTRGRESWGIHLGENMQKILWESRGPLNKGDLIIQLLPVWLFSLLAGCYTAPQGSPLPCRSSTWDPHLPGKEGPRDLTSPHTERSWATVQVACSTSIPVEAGTAFAPFCKAVTLCCTLQCAIIKQFVQFLLD